MNKNEPAARTQLTFLASIKDIGRTLKLSWQLEPFQILIYATGAISEITGTLVSTYAGARLISILFTAVNNPIQRSSVWFWLALSIAGTLAISVGFWLMNYSKRIIYTLAGNWSSINFMRQLSSIDIHAFYDTESRNNINKLKNGYSWQISQVSNLSLDMVYGFFRLLAIMAVVASIAWWVAPFLLLFLIPNIVAETKKSKANWFVWDEKGDERHIFWGITGIMSAPRSQLEIRAMQAKNILISTIDKMLVSFQQRQREILRNANWTVGISSVLEVVGVGITQIWLIVRVLYRHNLSISSYIFYASVITRINGALNTVAGSYTYLMQEALPYAHDFYEFLQVQPTIVDQPGAVKIDPKSLPEIEFEDVWFKYPGSDKWVFEGLSFTIKPGEHLAMIGENGAGKTTIIKLLLRFYEVEKGSIKINGHDIQTIELDSWYKQLGTLFQQFNEYPLDIAHNITISQGGQLDKKRLDEAVKGANLQELVDGLPYGLETVLDSSFKKGVEPSGGQWQKVALARAFYRAANVLILDEPTAAIDARAEYDIFNNIFKNQASKSAIIISHRFSTVRRAERIIVLEKGKIVQEGTHVNLMKDKNGLYHEMFEKQAEGYR